MKVPTELIIYMIWVVIKFNINIICVVTELNMNMICVVTELDTDMVTELIIDMICGTDSIKYGYDMCS